MTGTATSSSTGRDFAERDLPAAPLLAVEILSPSTRLIDLNLKRARYQQAGSPSYWVVDPEARTVTVWELAADGYAEAASAGERELLEVGNPFEVRIPVAELFA
ncbi:Uma2 family endonuclease [Naumannella huperziae]